MIDSLNKFMKNGLNHSRCVYYPCKWYDCYLEPIAYKLLLTLLILTGVGCDAKVALEIHNLREENPERFYSQVTKW